MIFLPIIFKAPAVVDMLLAHVGVFLEGMFFFLCTVHLLIHVLLVVIIFLDLLFCLTVLCRLV